METRRNLSPPPKESGTFGSVSFVDEEVKNIGFCLEKKLGKEMASSRTGAGASYSYIESWKVIQFANAIFGFNGWSCSVVDLSPDYIEESNGRFSVGVTAVVKVTLKDGTFHEDVGFGSSDNLPSRGKAISKAKKEAVSDARKRALRLFGNALGNCLYDKQHLRKMKTKNPGDDILSLDDLPTYEKNFPSMLSPPLPVKPELIIPDVNINLGQDVKDIKPTAIKVEKVEANTSPLRAKLPLKPLLTSNHKNTLPQVQREIPEGIASYKPPANSLQLGISSFLPKKPLSPLSPLPKNPLPSRHSLSPVSDNRHQPYPQTRHETPQIAPYPKPATTKQFSYTNTRHNTQTIPTCDYPA